MKKIILLTACLVLTLGGCAEMDTIPAAAAPISALDEAIASAEKEIAAAKKAGLWLHTEKFLEDAKAAKAEGKTDDALKLAKKAIKQAQLAQKQAQADANAKPYYPN
jgi:hypothetical protein